VGFRHDLESGDGIGSQTGQAICGGAFENVNHGTRCIDGTLELGETGADVVGMVVVIVCDEEAVEPGDFAGLP
jgi:hypothetical protein